MDTTILFHTFQNSSLLTTLLFGLYLIYKQLPKSRIKKILIAVLILWSSIIAINSYNQLTNNDWNYDAASPLNPIALINCLISQPLFLLLFYNLIFTFKKSLKIIAMHYAIILAIAMVIFVVDINSSASYFDTYSSIKAAYANIGTPLMALKLLFVVVQVLFSICMVITAYRLVPIYQKYIECNESNMACNTLWIKEISGIIFLNTIVYVLNILFLTYTTATIYYVVVIVAFIKMINVFLLHNRLEDYGELYSKLNIKWNIKRLWYTDEKAFSNKVKTHTEFQEMINWIQRERPYANPNFSYSDFISKYNNLSYNEFDTLLKDKYGHNFQSYIRECRIAEAIRLIDESDDKPLLKDISYRVGFESNSAFSRAFKIVKGVSASDWRNYQLSKRS